jgi:Zn-dependent protease with chaperone function
LVKLATAGKARSAYTQQAALEHLERQDDEPGQLFAEALSTHPLIANRIQELRKFAASAEYQALKHGETRI